MAEKWPRFGRPRPSSQLGWAVNWVDRLRTSADKRMWSGRRAVVMVRWVAVGRGCSALIRRSSWTGDWAAGHEGYPPPDCSGQKEGQSFLVSSWASRAVAAAPSFQTCFACVHMYILYACVYICVCVYVCGHVFIYICACVYVYLYVCVYTHVYVYVYAYLCIDWESQYQCLACGRCNGCACVTMYICMRMHMGVGIYICAFFCSECYMHFGKVFWTLVHGQVCTLHRCVFTPTCTSANTLAAGRAHMCIFIHLCICMHICMDTYDPN